MGSGDMQIQIYCICEDTLTMAYLAAT